MMVIDQSFVQWSANTRSGHCPAQYTVDNATIYWPQRILQRRISYIS